MIAPQLSTKERLVDFARELGFNSCRVAAATTPSHATEFRQWLQEGAAGEMSWIERGSEKRCDPQKVLPGARSVVVVALNYWQGERLPEKGEGRIARYAWGRDYHDLM